MADEDYDEVWRRSRDQLWRVAWLICGDADLADDVLAAAASRTWRAWASRHVGDADAYLRRAVVNEATDRFRSRARDRRWLDRRTGEGRGAREVEDEVAERADLAAALGRLPVGQRAVIVLRYWADLPEAAIADALSIRAGTVKSRTRRALSALAADLDRAATTAPEASDA